MQAGLIGLDWGLITYIVRSELLPHTNERTKQGGREGGREEEGRLPRVR